MEGGSRTKRVEAKRRGAESEHTTAIAKVSLVLELSTDATSEGHIFGLW